MFVIIAPNFISQFSLWPVRWQGCFWSSGGIWYHSATGRIRSSGFATGAHTHWRTRTAHSQRALLEVSNSCLHCSAIVPHDRIYSCRDPPRLRRFVPRPRLRGML